MSTAQILKR